MLYLTMQNAYNKLDIVVNIAVSTHFNMISILHGLLKSASMNILKFTQTAILIQYLVNILLAQLKSV